ncbi:MAG: SLBB domain-containing protein [Treponema sp.]|jgi:electron transport complex protein RnfC|nr:SLBB domain-containing protein [Treponema sp.]
MKVYSFPQGGISFGDPDSPPKDRSTVAFLPGISVISLIQHAGDRAEPTVSIGDYVREGMLIGRARGTGSANIHAPVPGKVIRMVSWKSAGGILNDALVIRMEGAFELLGKPEAVHPWEGLSAFELRQLIADFGIVEMEGRGLPVAEILAGKNLQAMPGNVPSKSGAGTPLTLVIRCVFDDPWLAADIVLCRERIKAVVEGAVIAARAAQVTGILFAVTRGEQALGKALLAEAESYNISASLALVGSRYPQSNRRELEMVLRVYEKGENLSLGGMIILGPATLAAIHDAVKLRKPILERYVAVGGSAVKSPEVMKVRIGTRIGELFAECGGFIDKPKRIASGSPFLGRAVADLDEPVIKTTYAVFARLNSHLGERRTQNCISCGECRLVCPVGLDPEELYKRIQTGGDAGGANRCHGCGCCEVVCPSHLPLIAAIVNFTGREKQSV